jgi:bifunctional ADP-heptose synthase (sugar kinase/adenylyltransferase)
MAALESVDAVILFEEDTPLNLIKEIKPDILVKGGDYPVSEIVGSDFVLMHGGKVKTLSLIPNYSTTGIEQKLKNQS